ncbi:hypothetical protein [Sphingobium sp. WCS2017Hpa-17]|uniref:hypothetical protein n=1 Tax=Sphingobium sp. WCS2017Hpa-17 TaxID=3073638 RepID=UPI00288A687C|nr:hypothetical protein [Sphingobium sp. WCS2017Hpa-17]
MTTPRSVAARYRPAWREPVGQTRTEKKIGDVEITATGTYRQMASGWERVA